MNLSTRFMPRPSAKGGGFSAIAAGGRLGWRSSFHFVTLVFLGVRKVRVTVLTTAILCSTVGRLVAVDPSVEVFTQYTTGTSAPEGDITLLPQLPFRWTVAVNGGYDSNVNTVPEGGGTAFTQANLTLSKDLRTERTQLSIVAVGGVIHYFDRIGGPPTDYTGSVNASIQHNISERLALAASINAAYQAEPEFGTDLGSARRTGITSPPLIPSRRATRCPRACRPTAAISWDWLNMRTN